MSTCGRHLGEHGPHVSWRFLKKLPWAMCPIGINISIIPHYFFVCWTLVLGTFFFVITLFCFIIAIKSCWDFVLHVLFFVFLFHDLNLKLNLALFSCWIRNLVNLVVFMPLTQGGWCVYKKIFLHFIPVIPLIPLIPLMYLDSALQSIKPCKVGNSILVGNSFL